MPKTAWEQWGQAQTWLTRPGPIKHMHGQAFFPRSNVPPCYIGAPWPEWPNPHVEPATPDSTVCLYDDNTQRLTFIETFDPFPAEQPVSGISIFQINPKAATKTWERKHTRLIAARYPWPTTSCDDTIIADLAWQPRPADSVRYFARAWTEQFFRHVGPAWAEIDYAPITCRFTEDQWEALHLAGTPCHGMVQTYRILDYFDGMLKGCPLCQLDFGTPWDGTFTTSALRCIWHNKDDPAPPASIDGRNFYAANLVLADAAWHFRVICSSPFPPYGFDIWRGRKFHGQTPVGQYHIDVSDCPAGQPDVLEIEEA